MPLECAERFGMAPDDRRQARQATSHPGGGRPGACVVRSLHREPFHVLADIVRAIGERHFAAVAARRVLDFMDFEWGAVVVHPRMRQPYVLFDNFDAAHAREGLHNYVAFTHVANPMLAHADDGRGALRARDFACVAGVEPSNPYLVPSPGEELGYRTVGWPERLEEVGLYFRMPDGLVELSVYRPRGHRPAAADKLAGLEALRGPIAAAFDRHAASMHRGAAVPPPGADGALTPRETEVLHLLLAGCGSEAVALRLGLSRHTVKDYRKQIFRKLSVTSLAELFALHRQKTTPLSSRASGVR
jgi:DNA-binding CsgD family transcriptional regulator